ncbi:SMP-30/gluconolactonase/LRE family protein [Sphingomonas sp. RP10(2022)]|uniref:SMP-30/gluconolactonase/LRE family protein n=1 Tax=Sphingomonas liriopis TaxID=2949094 RepID=A0A9X2HVT8_9SPHN|nr:SMP-30/gluconolactonase/LRE family protein [Sphingomonas liriopis]MCP3736439.1 SMP-30/gluconolactonase/LRE family protein [Sphingomonas liriopis]
MTDRHVRTVLPVQAILGEGPVWIGRDAALWFVDIKSRHVHRFDPASGAARRWDAPDQVGWVLPAADGGMIAGLKSGLHRFDPANGSFTFRAQPPGHPACNRLNDATTDRAGRIWFGTMDDGESAASGRLFRHAGGMIADSGLPPVCITNGPAIGGDTLYHTDTVGRTIWRAAIRDDGTLGPEEVFVRIEDGAGHPDGSVVDAEGCLWVALWGGWGVRRYDPAGALIGTVKLPAAQITKIAFGGPDLSTAYATSARKGLDAAALAEQPEAGNLFAFDAGVAGVAVTPVAV